MKTIFLLLFTICTFHFTEWHNNLTEAKQLAKKEHKYILLNFSGSDWCGPCIRMHKEIFDNPVFKQMADTTLIMVNADFPRMKKNQLSKTQQQLNEAAADQYNPKGKFPYTLLLNADGKVIKDWDGLPDESAENFTTEVRNGIYVDSER
ncbi:MAG: thioredoxin family protein [Bacteroidetes bacterium]|nr:thioredoxin family protein [Bacteroidota bacterium]MBS1934891.1 thioredoxin family protein [Bacteroidota bacterium]